MQKYIGLPANMTLEKLMHLQMKVSMNNIDKFDMEDKSGAGRERDGHIM